MKLTVATVQFNAHKGKVAHNLDRIAQAILQADQEGADLVVFPESAPTGYILEGGVEELAMSPQYLAQQIHSRLTTLSKPIDMSIGFYQSNPAGQPYNSAAYIEFTPTDYQVNHTYNKFFLPTYKVFDEERFLQQGDSLGIVESRFGKIGLLICEDVWHSILSTLLAAAGCHLILVNSASPARGFNAEKPSNVLRYESMLTFLAAEHGIHYAMAMLTGSEGGKMLVGGSMVVSPYGEIIVQSPTLGEHIAITPIDTNHTTLARQQTPLANDLTARWTDIKTLIKDL